ncbi:sulfatase family protein [Sinomonas atrocyanea]|uniref:sulfatase family protein n=1 Tax=Sinomonas atrocyanea TaxID=37927 RepID=UPI003D982CF3
MTNILLITADDMDGRIPGPFGGPTGATPNLDRLAGAGTVFRRAHVPAAVCQPSRSALMTGLWPHRNGAEGFEPIDDGIGVLNDLLKDKGYLTGILGKVKHLQPVERFGWDLQADMQELGMGRNPAAYGRFAEAFLRQATSEGRPWFLMANSHDPHRPFHGSEAERSFFSDEQRELYPAPSKVFTADEVEVPGFLPDLPEVRTEYAQYLSSVRRCDDTVGALLDALDRSGAADETLVVYLSDHGMPLPFAKANCYLRSTLTPLILRWPGTVPAGEVNSQDLVSTLDLFPTFCAAAGINVPTGLDGRTLIPLLRGPGLRAWRESLVSVFHETSAKNRYEMRCVQDAHYGYIWNAWADGHTHYKAENMWGLTWSAMLEAAETDSSIKDRSDFYLTRSPEELYDLTADPDCLHNLAGNPDLADVLAEKQAALAAWMSETGDPLLKEYQGKLEDLPA